MGSSHSTESSSDHEHYRKKARECAVRRQELCEQSQLAYRSGDGARARDLSLEAQEWKRKMDDYNNKAKELVFKANNASRPANEIDLHGLKVKEAKDIVRERLTKFVKHKEPNLIIIVGRGNNSLNGPKIKPAVIELVKEFRIKATPGRPNPGCIYIEPLPEDGRFDFSWIAKGLWGALWGLSSYLGSERKAQS